MSLIEWIPWIVYLIVLVLLVLVHLSIHFPIRQRTDSDWSRYAELLKENGRHFMALDNVLARTVLGVDKDATQEEIKTAYRRKAMKYHPDRGGELETFREIQAAYELLTRPVRCPDCEGKGTIKVKRGAFVDTVQCPRCWPQGGT